MRRRHPSPDLRRSPAPQHAPTLLEVKRQWASSPANGPTPTPTRRKPDKLPPMDPPPGSYFLSSNVKEPAHARASPEPFSQASSPAPAADASFAPVGVHGRKPSVIQVAAEVPEQSGGGRRKSQFAKMIVTPSEQMATLFNQYIKKADQQLPPFDKAPSPVPWLGEERRAVYNAYGYAQVAGRAGDEAQDAEVAAIAAGVDGDTAWKAKVAEQRKRAGALVKVIEKLISTANAGGLGLAGSPSMRPQQPMGELVESAKKPSDGAQGVEEGAATQRSASTESTQSEGDPEVDPLQQADVAHTMFNLCFEHLMSLETDVPEKNDAMRLVLASMNTFNHELVRRANEDRKKVIDVLRRLDNAKKQNEEATAHIHKLARHYNLELAEAEGRRKDDDLPPEHRRGRELGPSLPPAAAGGKGRRASLTGAFPTDDSARDAAVAPVLPSEQAIDQRYAEVSDTPHFDLPDNVEDRIKSSVRNEQSQKLGPEALKGAIDSGTLLHQGVARPPAGARGREASEPGTPEAVSALDMNYDLHVPEGITRSVAESLELVEAARGGGPVSPGLMQNLQGIMGRGAGGTGLERPLEGSEVGLSKDRMLAVLFQVQKDNQALRDDKRQLSVEVMALQDMLRRARAILAQLKRERHPVVEGETSQILAQAVKRLKAVSGAQSEEQHPRIRHHIDFIDCVLKAAQEASVAGEHGGGEAFKRGFIDSMEHQMSAWLLSLQSSVQKTLQPTAQQDSPNVKQRKQLIGEARKVLVRLTQTWQGSYVHAIFGTWFKYTKGQKKLRKSLSTFFQGWMENSQMKVDDWFARWRMQANASRKSVAQGKLAAQIKQMQKERDAVERSLHTAEKEKEAMKVALEGTRQEKEQARAALKQQQTKVPPNVMEQMNKLKMNVVPVAKLALALGQIALMPFEAHIARLQNKPDATQLCAGFRYSIGAGAGDSLRESDEDDDDSKEGAEDEADEPEPDDGDDEDWMNVKRVAIGADRTKKRQDREGYLAMLKDGVERDDAALVEKMKYLEEMPMDEMLITWVNHQLRTLDMSQAGPGRGSIVATTVSNFDSDFADGLAFAKLIASINPAIVEKIPRLHMTMDPPTRMKLVDKAAGEMNSRGILKLDESGTLGTSEGRAERFAAFVAQLFSSHSGLQREDTAEELNMMRTKVNQIRHSWDSNILPWLEVLIRGDNEEDEEELDAATKKMLDQAPSGELRRRLEVKIRQVQKARRELHRLQEPQAEEAPLYSAEVDSVATELEAVQGVTEALARRVEAGSDLYSRLRQKALGFGWSMLGSKTEGGEKALKDHKQEREYKEYTKVEEVQIRDILKANMLEGAAATAEVESIRAVLAAHWVPLMQVFRFYAAGTTEGSVLTMNAPEFWKFIKDVNLHGSKKLSNDAINQIFLEVNIDKTTGLTYAQYPEGGPREEDDRSGELLQAVGNMKDAFANAANAPAKPKGGKKMSVAAESPNKRKSTVVGAPAARRPSETQAIETQVAKQKEEEKAKENPDRELVPFEFLEALLRLAAVKYKSEGSSPSERLEMLITKDIIVKACRIDTNPFRKLLCDPRIDRVFREHRKSLEKVFAFYAGYDKRDADHNRLTTINLSEFTQLMKDCFLLNNEFPEATVATIFSNILVDSENTEKAATEEEESDGKHQMLYAEFLEAIAATTVYKVQNPYLPLDQRISTFLTKYILEYARQAAPTKAFKGFEFNANQKPKPKSKARRNSLAKFVDATKVSGFGSLAPKLIKDEADQQEYERILKEKERNINKAEQDLKKAEADAQSAIANAQMLATLSAASSTAKPE